MCCWFPNYFLANKSLIFIPIPEQGKISPMISLSLFLTRPWFLAELKETQSVRLFTILRWNEVFSLIFLQVQIRSRFLIKFEDVKYKFDGVSEIPFRGRIKSERPVLKEAFKLVFQLSEVLPEWNYFTKQHIIFILFLIIF